MWASGLRGSELEAGALALHRLAVLVQRLADDEANRRTFEGRPPSPTTSRCKRELPDDDP